MLALNKISASFVIQAPYFAYILAAHKLLAQEKGISEGELHCTIVRNPITQLSGAHCGVVETTPQASIMIKERGEMV